jgi:hypothetical protein
MDFHAFNGGSRTLTSLVACGIVINWLFEIVRVERRSGGLGENVNTASDATFVPQ